MKNTTKAWLITSGGLIGLGIICSPLARPGHPPNWPGAIIAVGFVLFIFPPILLMGWRLGGTTSDGLQQALRPIPEPYELKYLLEEELDRPVTLSETLEVHRYLISVRNEGILTAGIGIGALYLINKAV